MKTKTMLSTLVVCLLAVIAAFAANPNLGTWKLNEAKSKIPSMAPKNDTVVYQAVGDNIKVTVDGSDGMGKATHNEWTGKFDGKDYPLIGDATSNTRAYKKIDDRTTELTNKKDGKVTATGRIVLSADGKTRTVTITGDAMGKKVTYTATYGKQ